MNEQDEYTGHMTCLGLLAWCLIIIIVVGALFQLAADFVCRSAACG